MHLPVFFRLEFLEEIIVVCHPSNHKTDPQYWADLTEKDVHILIKQIIISVSSKGKVR
jgi:hypothetical protein